MKKKVIFFMAVAAFIFSVAGFAAADPVAAANIIQVGKAVKIHYTLTVDGQVVDSSRKGAPVGFVQGKGSILPALEKQLEGLKAGDKRQVTLSPEQGYGPVDPKAFVEVPKDHLPKDGLKVGAVLMNTAPSGQQMRAIVSEIKSNTAILNMNHPLAGKELHFDVEVMEIS